MAQDDFKPKLGRIRDSASNAQLRTNTQVLRETGRSGARAVRQRGHITSAMPKRGMGAGVRAAAGLIAPGSRRVIVKARYTRITAGDMGAAQAHLKYIQRDGVTREGDVGRLYDAQRDDVDGKAFLERSENDPHQFRFIVSAEDSARLSDLKPFIRDLLAQMERDLDTKLDWVAVDHFNTGHPHTHVVIRGRDDQGRDLVMARDYIGHGVRARAQALVTLELGPETQLERIQKLFDEVGQERLTRLDRQLMVRAKDNILVISATEENDPTQRTLRIGRLRTLQRLGLASERQAGVWSLDGNAEAKLRQLGERDDKFKMMQRALKEAGIERSAAAMALFERLPRKVPLVGKVVGVGMVDEITDRTWVIIDAVDGRVHYAELGRLKPEMVPVRGHIVALAGDGLNEKPSSLPRLHLLSATDLDRQTTYEGPTWLDEAIVSRWQPETRTAGFTAEVDKALKARTEWLVSRQLIEQSQDGKRVPRSDMLRVLRQAETQHLAADVSRRFNAAFVPAQSGARITGTYDHAITTPTGRIAVIRREDTFTFAPWQPSLEPYRGQAVAGIVGPTRITWTHARGRSLPGRA
jgi:type IV secretory pathway VirD2 relaxase